MPGLWALHNRESVSCKQLCLVCCILHYTVPGSVYIMRNYGHDLNQFTSKLNVWTSVFLSISYKRWWTDSSSNDELDLQAFQFTRVSLLLFSVLNILVLHKRISFCCELFCLSWTRFVYYTVIWYSHKLVNSDLSLLMIFILNVPEIVL